MKFSVLFRWLTLAAVLAAGLALGPKPAQAYARFGVVVGPPIVVGPVYGYYPAPVYYYPPPAYAYPATPVPPGTTCYAAPYVCPLLHAHPVGGNCACPAYGGSSVPGTVR